MHDSNDVAPATLDRVDACVDQQRCATLPIRVVRRSNFVRRPPLNDLFSKLSEQLGAVRPALLAYARRAVHNDALAEDLVHETITSAMDHERAGAESVASRPWLTAMLAQKIADHARAHRRADAPFEEESLVDLSAAAADVTPETHAARAQALTALASALATLPQLERLAVLSVDVEGLAHDEVSVALGVSATHLRVLLHRGRHKLRKAIEHAVLSFDR